MNRAKTFYFVAGVHLFGIVLLVLGSFIKYLIKPKKPPEVVTWVNMEPPPVTPTIVEEQFKPEDIPKPPEPPKPEPPKPEPPKPKLKKPDEIKIAKKKIRRKPDAAPKPAPPKPRKTLSPEELKRLMAEEIKSTAPAPAMTPSELDFIYGLVREKMYGAWSQPTGLTAASGLTATVSIRLSRNGSVSQVRMVRASGHAAMDASVLQAARSVTHVASLPARFPGAYKDITIEFELRD